MLWIAGPACAADGVTAIETPGTGDLTMCFSMMMISRGCTEYHHVELPKRLAVGDVVPLTFSSENKQYNFPVARIIKNGIVCTVLDATEGDPQHVDSIKVPSCLDVTGAH
jgi:hypothetical protein